MRKLGYKNQNRSHRNHCLCNEALIPAVVEPSILHWLKSDLPSLEVIRQFSLFKQYKTDHPSSTPEDLDKPVGHGSTYTAGTHEGVHNNDYNTRGFVQNIDLVYKPGFINIIQQWRAIKTGLKVQQFTTERYTELNNKILN